jgi:hypothetical protein
LLIITPPHTASGNLNKALCAPPFNGQLVLGPNPSIDHDHHNVYIHPAWKHYKIALVIRNPLTRLVGLWLHYEWSKINIVKTWEEFVQAVAADNNLKLSWFFRWTIARLLEPLRYSWVRYLHYESLEDELQTLLSTPVKLPPAYHDKIVLSEWYSNNAIRDMAIAWAQPDRIRFGYNETFT